MNNFDALFYLNPHPMWVYAVDSLRILEVNNAAIRRYGYSRDEFIGKSIIDIRPEEDIPALKKVLDEPFEKVRRHNEFRHVSKSGVVMHVTITVYKINFNGISAQLVEARCTDDTKAMQGKLMLTQAKLDRLLDSTTIGFFQLDRALNFTYWNNAAETLVGFDRKFVIGKNIWDVFPEAINSDFHIYLEKAVTDNVNVEFTEYFWPIQKWFFINAYPGEDGMLVHFRDVSHIKRSQEILLEKIEQLREISFLNSHYIRKPVASLLGLTNLIKEDIVNADEFKIVASQIQECSLELDEVIKKINKKVNDGDNLKDVAFEMEEFTFETLVKDVVSDYKPQAPEHAITFNSHTNRKYYGSKLSIRMAIECLLDNAIKFSPNGGDITVTLSLLNQNLVLSVQDFGVGMDSRLVNKIFQGFIHKEHARELGEGLARVAEVARRHHGNIWVESQPGKGALFSIRFPLSNVSAFKAGEKTDYSIRHESDVVIEYIEKGQYIKVDWQGFHSLQTIRAGCLKLAGILAKHQCSKVLNSNSNLIGSWEDAAEWVGTECIPMLERAGLRYVAWVYSPSTFGRLSTDIAIEALSGGTTVKTFENETAASQWLEGLNSYKPE